LIEVWLGDFKQGGYQPENKETAKDECKGHPLEKNYSQNQMSAHSNHPRVD
jgi:hypothetical protein